MAANRKWLPKIRRRKPTLKKIYNKHSVYGVVPARISSQSSRHCWRSPLPHASALIQRDFGCILGVQQIKQLPHVAKADLVWQLVEQPWLSIVEQPWTTCFLSAKDLESEPVREAIQSGD
ncbi:hypothetical protein TNCV_1468351 [Trichonephila clavipes]|uniref:Uncharacterized protein n=1 Tax=Trichonephila clavipes TaxID=2585209 RepID=A0A8X6RU56_TRICX|nr:hypothetical protein TNCV_1468351 [Trichonephila clavipes]